MKETKILLIGGMLALGLGTLASCKNAPLGDETKLSNKEAFRLEAATSMNLVANLSSSPVSKKVLRANEISDSEATKIKEMLPTVDLILDNGASFLSTITEEETEINGTIYSFKEVITFKNSELKDETYTLVYNATEKVERDYDDEENDDEKNDEDTEIETSKTMKGYAIYDQETMYEFVSIMNTEEDSEETEIERSFRINLNENSYVKVSQETEQEENENSTEFEYTYVENGDVKLNYSIEVENEGNKNEIEYEIGEKEYELVRLNQDNETTYKIYLEVDDKDDDHLLATFKKVVGEDGIITYERVI